MNSISSLINKHSGKTICVMGGAPSLIEDLKKIDADVYISANQHGCLVRQCDYIAAVDLSHLVTGQHMGELLKPYNTPIISSHFYADYRIVDYDTVGFAGNSGMLAIMIAGMLGANLIVVAGIEMYQGKAYFHDPEAHSPGFGAAPERTNMRVNNFTKLVKGLNVRKLSGPLPFPEYDPQEKISYSPMPQWMQYFKNKRVKAYKCVRDFSHHLEEFNQGQILYMTDREATRFGHDKVRLIKQSDRP